MLDLEIKLQKYIIGHPTIAIELDGDDVTTGSIVDARRGLVYGQLEVSEDRKLTFLNIDIDEIIDHNDVSLDEYEDLDVDDLVDIAGEFVAEFSREKIRFNRVSSWGGDSYLVVFEAKDSKLNLSLPSSGAMIEINKQGFILSANVLQSYYQLTYPDIEVSPEEAKGLLCKKTLVNLGIAEYNGELGLVYFPKNEYVGVHVDGRLVTTSEALDVESPAIRPIDPVTVTTTVEEMLGVTPDMVLLEENGVKRWYTPEQAAHPDDVQAVIRMDCSDENQIEYESNADWDESIPELPEEVLAEQAKMFLEAVVGNIHEKYLLEDQYQFDDEDDELTEEEKHIFESLEEEEESDLDEDDVDFEEDPFESFKTFTFIRHYNGLILAEYAIHVTVGIHSGLIKECVAVLPNEKALDVLNKTPELSLEAADAIYKEQLQLKLARTVEEEDEIIIYGLNYVIDFLNSKGHIEKISAKTGAIIYSESDLLKEAE